MACSFLQALLTLLVVALFLFWFVGHRSSPGVDSLVFMHLIFVQCLLAGKGLAGDRGLRLSILVFGGFLILWGWGFFTGVNTPPNRGFLPFVVARQFGEQAARALPGILLVSAGVLVCHAALTRVTGWIRKMNEPTKGDGMFADKAFILLFLFLLLENLLREDWVMTGLIGIMTCYVAYRLFGNGRGKS
jgi:hypothetical protein